MITVKRGRWQHGVTRGGANVDSSHSDPADSVKELNWRWRDSPSLSRVNCFVCEDLGKRSYAFWLGHSSACGAAQQTLILDNELVFLVKEEVDRGETTGWLVWQRKSVSFAARTLTVSAVEALVWGSDWSGNRVVAAGRTMSPGRLRVHCTIRRFRRQLSVMGGIKNREHVELQRLDRYSLCWRPRACRVTAALPLQPVLTPPTTLIVSLLASSLP